MLQLVFMLLKIISRERPAKLDAGKRVRVTLDLNKLCMTMPGGGAHRTTADVSNWLMSMGLSPTGKSDVWKGDASVVGRVPKSAIRKTEKL